MKSEFKRLIEASLNKKVMNILSIVDELKEFEIKVEIDWEKEEIVIKTFTRNI